MPFVPFTPLKLQAIHGRRTLVEKTTWINISALGSTCKSCSQHWTSFLMLVSPTEHLLLRHFIEGAVHPDKAAGYLLSIVHASQGQVEYSLRQLKQEWRHLVLLGTTPQDISVV